VNDTDADTDTKKAGLIGRLQDLKVSRGGVKRRSFSNLVDQNGLSDRIPQEHKDVTREKLEQGRKVLAEEYFPDDRRDQFIYRIKKVLS
jgi:Family of unknown function (DUF5923)